MTDDSERVFTYDEGMPIRFSPMSTKSKERAVSEQDVLAYLDEAEAAWVTARDSSGYGSSSSWAMQYGKKLIFGYRRLVVSLNTPELHDFAAGVVSEAQHQRERWGTEQDAGKAPEDWFWLIGYLAGKALHSSKAGDLDKVLHHTITCAAALANWHAAEKGHGAEFAAKVDGSTGGGDGR